MYMYSIYRRNGESGAAGQICNSMPTHSGHSPYQQIPLCHNLFCLSRLYQYTIVETIKNELIHRIEWDETRVREIGGGREDNGYLCRVTHCIKCQEVILPDLEIVPQELKPCLLWSNKRNVQMFNKK